jgi:hypothetical protein
MGDARRTKKPQDGDLRTQAFELYKPPFRYLHGYVYDADANMVADETAHALRVRGWGRLTHVEAEDHEKLQDAVGELLAEALTFYWEHREMEKKT